MKNIKLPWPKLDAWLSKPENFVLVVGWGVIAIVILAIIGWAIPIPERLP